MNEQTELIILTGKDAQAAAALREVYDVDKLRELWQRCINVGANTRASQISARIDQILGS